MEPGLHRFHGTMDAKKSMESNGIHGFHWSMVSMDSMNPGKSWNPWNDWDFCLTLSVQTHTFATVFFSLLLKAFRILRYHVSADLRIMYFGYCRKHPRIEHVYYVLVTCQVSLYIFTRIGAAKARALRSASMVVCGPSPSPKFTCRSGTTCSYH